MLTATHAPQTALQAPPLIDLTVHDADFKPTDNPFISSIRVWYEHENGADKNETEDLEQIEACGHDFLNYMRNVRGRHYETLQDYWYDKKLRPRTRDKEVEEYLEYRVNSIYNKN